MYYAWRNASSASKDREMHLSAIAGHWLALHESLGLGSPITDEAHYEQMLAVVDQLFDAVAADPIA
jgi:HTH-type transcriptional regulator/antitoxin HigA